MKSLRDMLEEAVKGLGATIKVKDGNFASDANYTPGKSVEFSLRWDKFDRMKSDGDELDAETSGKLHAFAQKELKALVGGNAYLYVEFDEQFGYAEGTMDGKPKNDKDVEGFRKKIADALKKIGKETKRYY